MTVQAEPVLGGKVRYIVGGIIVLLGLAYAVTSGMWWILIGILIMYWIIKGGGSGFSSQKSYHRLVAWVEQNSSAKFDGSQGAGEVEQHLQAKLDELENQGKDVKQLAGLKAFIGTRSYDKLIKKQR